MKTIPEPNLKSGVVLSAVKMNSIHFGGRHTVLTRDQLEKMAAEASGGKSADVSSTKNNEDQSVTLKP